MAPTVIAGPLSRATSALCCPLGASAHLANAEKALVGRLRVGQLCTKMGGTKMGGFITFECSSVSHQLFRKT